MIALASPIIMAVKPPLGLSGFAASVAAGLLAACGGDSQTLGLRAADWRNVTVPGSVCGASHPIHLRRQRAVIDSARWPRWLRITVQSGWDPVVYGDLDGDGSDEAALGVNCNNGGATAGGILAYARVIFTARGEARRVLGVVAAQAPNRHGAPLLQVTIHRGRIVALEAWYGPHDGTCCPNGRSTSIWAFKNGELSLVSTVVKRRPPQ